MKQPKQNRKTIESICSQDLLENCWLNFWIYWSSFLSNFLSFWYIFLSLLVTFSLFNCCYNQFRNNTMLQFTPIIFIAFLWYVYVIVFGFFIPFKDSTIHWILSNGPKMTKITTSRGYIIFSSRWCIKIYCVYLVAFFCFLCWYYFSLFLLLQSMCLLLLSFLSILDLQWYQTVIIIKMETKS